MLPFYWILIEFCCGRFDVYSWQIISQHADEKLRQLVNSIDILLDLLRYGIKRVC